MDQGTVKEGFGIELFSRVQLRAVFSGVVVAIGVFAICLGLSWAIGLSTFQPTAHRARGLALGLIIWGAVALAISIFAGAFVAALVGRSAEVRDGVLHGLVVWGSLAAFLCLAFMGLFAGVMHDLLVATGGNMGRIGPEDAPMLDAGSRAVIVEMAHEAADILWIYWAGLVAGLGTALVGGWLGARAEGKSLLRHGREEHAPIGPVAPRVPQPA
ncbi:MAG TPA: hypothetical protein VF997_14560 [Polyangia bacterium]